MAPNWDVPVLLRIAPTKKIEVPTKNTGQGLKVKAHFVYRLIDLIIE